MSPAGSRGPRTFNLRPTDASLGHGAKPTRVIKRIGVRTWWSASGLLIGWAAAVPATAAPGVAVTVDARENTLHLVSMLVREIPDLVVTSSPAAMLSVTVRSNEARYLVQVTDREAIYARRSVPALDGVSAALRLATLLTADAVSARREFEQQVRLPPAPGAGHREP